MRCVSVNIDKGGTGKSTVIYNYAYYLARKGNKVLLIDADESCNLTLSFPKAVQSGYETSIADVFNKGEVNILNVDENIDLIPGSPLANDDSLDLKSKQNNCMLLYMYIADHYEEFNQYDFVLIDTHNDASLLTKNCIAASDVTIAVCDPSKNGYRAWKQLLGTIETLKSELIDVISRRSYVSVEAYLVANMINFVGNNVDNVSKTFLDTVVDDDRYIGLIPRKTIVANTLMANKSIFTTYDEMSASDKKKNQKFFENIEILFDEITQKIAA
ncbi:ParA family protein [Enterococcus sp. DIV0240a]|uniref:ParA family protein n=1 Tax=Enterococcus sp. DIV0240a TaxID=2774651 RepID=UPI003D2AD048